MKKIALSLGIASLIMSGCATNDPQSEQTRITELENQLERTNKELAVARSQAPNTPTPVGTEDADLLPPNAEPGMCYARVWVAPTYSSYTEQVMISEASESVEIVPAKYEWAEETVLVKEASSRIKEVPAVYGTETDSVMVKDAQRVWRTALSKDSAPASQELLATAKNHGIDLNSATPGMCFHEHYRPARYETESQTVEISPASYRIETVPAEYRWVEKQVLVKEASTKLVEVPAEYGTETETVVDVPAHTIWKKGSGPIQRIDEATGEIMCLVEVPATYKTITKRVLISPARTETVDIPAEYKTVKIKELASAASEQRIDIPAEFGSVDITKKVSDAEFVWHEVHDTSEPSHTRTGTKICLTETPAVYKDVSRQVIVTPASTQTIDIPAEYKTIRVNKLVSAAQEVRNEIPAKYDTITLQKVDKEGFMEWRSILCETNTTSDLIRKLQSTLQDKGYNPGPIDGDVGTETMGAVNSYQHDNGLPVDKYLNTETLQHLGVL